jgi:hypothetical protein
MEIRFGDTNENYIPLCCKVSSQMSCCCDYSLWNFYFQYFKVIIIFTDH